MDYAQNMIVVKTLDGMGMAVAVALDNMQNSEILGTIAGMILFSAWCVHIIRRQLSSKSCIASSIVPKGGGRFMLEHLHIRNVALIKESEKIDLKNLEEGYLHVCEEFPECRVCKVHGKMKPAEKDAQMHLFVSGEAQIMVATTVIEVGVNVPNASVMVIENAERFGLSQLHQLRGRVGRGADQSYCILVTGYKLAEDTRKRLEIMVRTNDGFEIAEADLKLRGPGDLEGTQQSGIAFDLKIAI